MKRLAIIGSGISGLACLYFLASHYEVTLYEQNDYIGGHTNTVEVGNELIKLPVDTGFMVFNRATYPNLIRLFDALGIACETTDMSFSVRHDGLSLEYNGAGYNKLFGQRKNILNLRFWRMLMQLNRFNQEALEMLVSEDIDSLTLLEYVEKQGYGKDFQNLFLIPMSSAIWSTHPKRVLSFPAKTLLRFFHNHGFLGMDTHHQWYVVKGGSKQYVKKILELSSQASLMLNEPVQSVQREENGVIRVHSQKGSKTETREFDHVIVATHADQALRVLEAPTNLQQKCLSAFSYESNIATLHTDSSVLPKNKRCRASWNYHIQTTGAEESIEDLKVSTHYWMNRLQHLGEKVDYIVSINGESIIQPERVLKRIDYQHPVFDLPAIQAQKTLPELNCEGAKTNIYFCGSYFNYGFHEDAFTSGMNLSEQLLGDLKWRG